MPADSAARARGVEAALGLAFLTGLAALALDLLLLDFVRRGVEFAAGLQLAAILYLLAHVAGALAIAVGVGDPLRRLLLLAGWFLFATAVFPSLGLLGPLGALPAGAIGLAAGVLSWRAGLPRPGGRLPILLLLALLAAGLLGLAGYQHQEGQTHFFLPEFARLGILHKDPLGFLSLAAQIRDGILPGAALDGIQLVPYHFGIHYFFVGLAELTGARTAEAFVAGQHLVSIPLLLFYAALATAELLRLRPAPAPLAVPLAAGLVLALPSMVWLVGYYSESSTVSTPLLFLFLPLVAAWRPEAGRGSWPALGGVVLVALCAAVLKVSAAVLLLPLAGYLALRLLLAPARAVGAFVALGLLALLLAAAAWPSLTGTPFRLDFSRDPGFGSVAKQAWWALGLVAAAALAQLLRRRTEGGRAGGETGALAPLWLLLLWIAPLGTIAIGNLQNVVNGSYLFNDVVLAVGPVAALELAILAERALGALAGRSPRRLPAARAGLAVLLFGLFLLTLECSRLVPSIAFARIDALAGRICARVEGACPADGGLLPQSLSSATERAIAGSEGGRLAQAAEALVAEGAQAFFVPPSAGDVWDFLLHQKERPIENLMFLPAMTGRPMLLGLPPAPRGVPLAMVHGGILGDYDDRDRSRAIDDAGLCRQAQRRGVAVVGVIDGLTPSPRTRLLRCGSDGPAGTAATQG
ncbi:hypothetical protein SAMN06265365_107203 [Tistlia consotensis]|uniref:Uncharacterized protein n=1 Tax=Tistlia consotensis USBA 355 TaxID=560819 RepID=A0A1Y6B9Z9_9PROT|nr:hypothetical protein [Tistlia consotensis]SME98770.1 hypothetical protein SAMN05428998_102205 [Tistlia consotensis USBA 355]SNR58163.1 hypothetical protein SAMN06265365_107203 [Tistlia consotensis]